MVTFTEQKDKLHFNLKTFRDLDVSVFGFYKVKLCQLLILFLNMEYNIFPRKNRVTIFYQPLQWILCEGQMAKNLNFFIQIFTTSFCTTEFYKENGGISL